MSFLRYPSIDNHYRSKEIAMWLGYHPELANARYIAREKLDGSNLALWFLPDGRIKVASRNNFIGYLGDDVRFNGAAITELFNSTEVYKALVDGFKSWAVVDNMTYIVFGEIFGGGIQNRVNYGKDKYFRAFDVMVGGKMVSQAQFDSLFDALPYPVGGNDVNIDSLKCPLIAMFDSLEEALAYDVNTLASKLTPADHPEGKPNLAEGIVIKPYEECYQSPQGSVFYLKMKNEKFKDNEAKPQKEKKPVDEGLAALNADFREYINENRILDVFSKHGAIEKPSQIGEYIRYVMEDAKVDFLKDHAYSGDKNADKVVFNVGSLIADLLKEKM